MKNYVTFILLFFNLNLLFAQAKISFKDDFDHESSFKSNTYFFEIDRPKGEITVVYQADANDSLLNKVYLDIDGAWKVTSNFKKIGDFFEAKFSYNDSMPNNRLLLYEIRQSDTSILVIYLDLVFNSINLNDVDAFTLSCGAMSRDLITVNGDNLDYLKLRNINKWNIVKGTNVYYKYFIDTAGNIKVQLKNSYKHDTILKNVELKLFTVNSFFDEQDSIINYKTLTIRELNIVPQRRQTIDFPDSIFYLGNSREYEVTIKVNDPNLKDGNYFLIFNKQGDRYHDTVAKVIVYRTDKRYIYKCQIKPLNSTEKGFQFHVAKIRGKEYIVNNLKIYRMPKVIKVVNIAWHWDTLQNNKKLYYNVDHKIILEGTNLDKIKILVPKQFKLTDSSKEKREYEVYIPYTNKKQENIDIKIKYPEQLNLKDGIITFKVQIWKQKNYNFEKKEFIKIKYSKSNTNQKEEYNNEILELKNISGITIYIDTTLLGNIGDKNYYGRPKLFVKLYSRSDSINLPEINLNKNDSLNIKISDIKAVLEKTKLLDTLRINVYDKNKEINYLFEVPIAKNSLSWIDLGIGYSPITINTNNLQIIDFSYAKLSLGIDFYTLDERQIRKRVLSSATASWIVTYNSVNNQKFDTGLLFEIFVNPSNSPGVQNRTNLPKDTFDMTFGVGYLWLQKLPIITLGVNLSLLNNLGIKH